MPSTPSESIRSNSDSDSELIELYSSQFESPEDAENSTEFDLFDENPRPVKKSRTEAQISIWEHFCTAKGNKTIKAKGGHRLYYYLRCDYNSFNPKQARAHLLYKY